MQRKGFILRNWLTWLWRLGESQSDGVGLQTPGRGATQSSAADRILAFIGWVLVRPRQIGGGFPTPCRAIYLKSTRLKVNFSKKTTTNNETLSQKHSGCLTKYLGIMVQPRWHIKLTSTDAWIPTLTRRGTNHFCEVVLNIWVRNFSPPSDKKVHILLQYDIHTEKCRLDVSISGNFSQVSAQISRKEWISPLTCL